jgi:hypothetical protein
MVKGVEAHFRRNIELLRWIDLAHAEAMLFSRGSELGVWNRVVGGWRAEGLRIYIRLNEAQVSGVRRVKAVRSAPWGVTITVAPLGPGGREKIHVVWRETSLDRMNACDDAVNGLWSWARRKFPGCSLVSVARRTERALSLSGQFIRLLVHHRGLTYLVMAAIDGSPADQCHGLLTQALLWDSHLREGRHPVAASRAFLFVPAGQADVLCHRSACLDPARRKQEVWEFETNASGGWRAAKAQKASIPQEDRDYRWPVLGPFRWSSSLSQVLDLAPSLIRRHPRFREYDSLRLHGLEFARAYGDERDRIQFGVGPFRTELNEGSFGDLQTMVEEILYYRRPDSPDPRHPYYRLQAERWLECLILDDIAQLFPELISRCVYPQIPIYLGELQGRLDVLAVDLEGTLVVMELKTAPDPGLPLQALDYWGRVIQHNRNGDFERRGYFTGIRLSRNNPKIYLVAPVFSFHDSTEKLLCYFNPAIEVWKIAVNEDWRGGVEILRRTKCRCGRPSESTGPARRF